MGKPENETTRMLRDHESVELAICWHRRDENEFLPNVLSQNLGAMLDLAREAERVWPESEVVVSCDDADDQTRTLRMRVK